MKRAYRIMAATLTLAIALGNIDLSVLATEATYSVNETEEVSTEQVENDNPIMEVIEEQADESGLEQVSETEEIETENTETVEENNEDLSETTETSPTVGEQDEEAETQEEVVVESTESEESVENDEIMEEKTETVLTVGEQVTEAETLEDEVIEKTEETVSGNSIEIEEETETSPTVGEQDEEAETLEKDIIKFMVTFVDSEGNEVYSVEVSEVDEIELPEAPELDGYEFIKWDIDLSTLELTEDLVIEPIYEEVEEEKEPELAYCELSKTVDNKVVSIKGIMPENAEIVVEKVKYTANIKKDIEESLNDKATVVVYEAFDIKIKVDNTEYQPNEFDESVVVSIKNINVKNKENEELKVFHIDNSNNIEEVESTVDTSSKVAEFVAESFSVYVISGITYNTDDATLLENNYGTAYLYADGTLLVTEFKQNATVLEIYPWCTYKEEVKTVNFSDDITYIGYGAFHRFAIEEVNLPAECLRVEDKAFANINDLRTINFNSKLEIIGASAFECTGNSLYTREDDGSLTGLMAGDYYTFTSDLRRVNFPDSLKVIGDNAFDNVHLVQVSFGSNLESIGVKAFYNNHLSEINIPGGNDLVIKNNAFEQEELHCSCEAEHNDINDNVLGLAPLKNVTLGSGVKEIEDYAFYANNGIAAPSSNSYFYTSSEVEAIFDGSITIADSVTTIGDYAFKGVKANVINGGNGVQSIGTHAFNVGTYYGMHGYNLYVSTTVNSNNDLINNLSWKTNNYRNLPVTISFDTDGGNNINNMKIPYNSLLNVEDAVKDGKDFYCWGIYNSYGTLQKIDLASYRFTKDTTIYALWRPVVTYDLDGGYFADELKTLAPNLVPDLKPFYYDGSKYTAADGILYEGLAEGHYFILPDRYSTLVSDDSIYMVPKKDGYRFDGYTVTGSYYEVTNFRQGYEFRETFLNDYYNIYAGYNNSSKKFTNFYEMNGDITLTANWTELPKYEITFETNGGSTVESQQVVKNNKVTEPVTSKTGYTFKGWFTDSTFTSEYDFSTPVTSAFTLYAKFEINEYTVSFDSEGYGDFADQVIEYDNLVTNPGEPNREGYIFLGWYNGASKWIFETDTVKGDIELLAKYEIKKYDVVYKVDGNQFHSEVVEHGSTAVGTPTEPTKTGYDFIGWFNGADEFDFITPVTGELKLDAKFEINKYEIQFNSNDGSTVPTQEIEYNQKVVRPTNPTKAGYEFKGWFTDSTCTAEYDFDTQVTGPLTLFAKWERITYSVQFNSNGGSAVGNQVIGEGDKVVRPTDPTLTHYEFKGWFKDQALTDEWDFNTDTVTAATTLYAKWEELPFVYVTYILDNGEPDVTSKYYAGETTVPPATPLKEKAVFEGWQYGTYVDVNYDTFVGWQEYIANYMTLHSGELLINDGHVNRGTHLAFKARYKNEVIEDVNDGVTPEKVTQQSNTVQYTLNTPSRDGYKFRWWNVYKNNAEETYMESQGFTRDVMYPIIYQPVIFRAEWIKIHTITFDSDGGTAVSSQTVEDGSVILKPADPTKEKHMFDGWYNGTEKWNFAVDVPNSDIELKAKWTYTPDKYQFTFNSNGGNSIPSQEITEGGTATRPTDPTRKGYTFKGWYTDTTFTTEYDFSEVLTGSTTIVAKWEINEYTISFDTQGGNVVPSQTLEFNSLVNKPSNPTKEGYTFRGWYKDPVGLVAWDFTSDVVEEDRTIIAVWDVNKFTVSFDSDGGSAVAAQVVEYNKQVTKPSNPTKSGYKFIGWFNGTDEFDFSTPVKEEITLKAKWEEVKVTPQPEDTEPTPDTDPDETPETETEPEDVPEETPDTEPETEPEEEPTEEPEVEPEVIEIIPEIVPEDIEPEIEIPVIEIEEDEIPEIEIPEIEDETPAEEIVADEEEAITVDNPLYSVKVEDNNMKNAMAKFVEAMKYMTIVLSISILAVLGILGLLLLLVAWMKKVKVHNDHNLDDYADEDFVVVYKTSVKSEGNRLAELFKKEDRVWTLSIPEEVVADRVTNSFKIELNKSFCKRYNGEQLIVVMENSNEELVKNLGFVIDEKENEIKFILA
ncbi:MAG: InlB B-repeat-containing protein [Lachnospiraceae bacterium]|nr:InlB B-repeat-containing protein [Lachnospiraceae bacterium]